MSKSCPINMLPYEYRGTSRGIGVKQTVFYTTVISKRRGHQGSRFEQKIMVRQIDIRGLLRPLTRTMLPILAALLCVFAAPLPQAFAAKQSAMVIDANTGKVLYNSAGDERRYPASLTKMMTLYLTFDLIEKGRLKYDDKITISSQAAAQAPSKLDLDVGDKITVRNAVMALITKSANDIAVALAEHIAGSEANFARLMTRKAHQIGMSKTTFRNASGLPNSEQLTTARDMITLALRLQDEFPEHYKLFATRRFSYAGASYRNHNTLLHSYRGTDGIKTGYTRASGFNLVASVHRGSKHLVAAVFGGKTAGQRNTRIRNILDRSYVKASTRRTRPHFSRPQLVARPKLIERKKTKSALAPSAAPPLPHATPAHTAPSGEKSVAAATPALTPPASPPPSAPQPAAQSAEPAATAVDQRISIARVRQVGITQHFAERRAAMHQARERSPQRSTQYAQANAISPSATGPRSISELIATTANAQTSGSTSYGTQHDGAITPTPGKGAPIIVPSQADDEQDPKPTAAMGRTPSTLQSQLSRILADHRPGALDRQPARASMETAALTRAPPAAAPSRASRRQVTTGSPAAGGTHLIQIGAYNTADEAERQLLAIRERARTVLASAAPVTQPVTRGQHQFFRARFTGFDSAGATSACQELRRRSIDCFVAKVP